MEIQKKNIGDKVRFSTHGIVDDVKQFEGEIVGFIGGSYHPNKALALTQHSNIYPKLPADVKAVTQNDFKSYNYVVLALADSTQRLIGTPWVVDASIEDVVERIATITVRTQAADGTRLRRILEQAGEDVVAVIL